MFRAPRANDRDKKATRLSVCRMLMGVGTAHDKAASTGLVRNSAAEPRTNITVTDGPFGPRKQQDATE